MKLRSLSPYLIIVAGILWAVDGVLRTNLYSLPPLTIVFFEHLIGLVLLLPFVCRSMFRERLTGKEWMLAFFIALFSGLLGTLWFTSALLLGAFSVTFLLQKLQPIFATLGGVLVLKEKVSPRFLGWAVLAFVSAYFVTFPNGYVDFSSGSWQAAMYAVGAAAVWGSSTILSKLLLKTRSYAVTTGYRFGLTTLLAFVGLFFMGVQDSVVQVTLPQYGQFLAIALSTGMIALLIYYRGLADTEAKISTFLELSFPLFAVLIDWVWFHNVLHPSQYFAGGVLMICFWFLSRMNYVDEIR